MPAIAGGESPPDARIDVVCGRLPDSPAVEVRAHVKALGGQQLKVAWLLGKELAKDSKPLLIHIHRVTDTRRVPLADVKLAELAETVTWAWEVPVVKGPARYEATLDLPVPVVLVIDARDRASHEAALKTLARAKITLTGAKDNELAALRLLGMKPVAARAATGVTDVMMLIEADANGAAAWRREIRFVGDASAELVWVSGPGSNDWRVRVPRAWIAPAVLATVEGRIRLLEILLDPSPLP